MGKGRFLLNRVLRRQTAVGLRRGGRAGALRRTGGSLLALCALTAAGQLTPDQATPPLLVTNLQQLHQLVAGETPVPCGVRLEGVVCAVAPAPGMVVVRDDSGVELLRLEAQGRRLEPGQRLRLTGDGCELLRRQLGVEIRRRPQVNNDGLHGMVEVASPLVRLAAGPQPIRLEWFNSKGALGLEVRYEGPGLPRSLIPPEALQRIEVDRVSGATRIVAGLDYAFYQGAWIRLPDFGSLVPDRTGVVTNFDLGVRSQDDDIGFVFSGLLQVPRDGEYRFFVQSDDGSRWFVGPPLPELVLLAPGLPVAARRIEIGQRLEANAPNQWAAVEGTANFVGEGLGGLDLELGSGSGLMQVHVADATGITPSSLLRQRLRVTGICPASPAAEEHGVCLMVTAGAKEIEILPGSEPAALEPDKASALPRLTTAEQVQRLSRAEAERGYPVTIQGVVTCVAPWFYYGTVLQDETRGIFASYQALSNSPAPLLGERWEIEGVTEAGSFAPMVQARRMRFLCQDLLPRPVQPTWDQLINGSLDTQYIQLRGLVTETHDDLLSLLTQWGKIQVRVVNPNPLSLRQYENTVVRVRGCLLALWDADTHQLKIGEFRLVNALIDIDRSAPADPFAAAAKTVQELLLFDLGVSSFQPVKVAGQFLAERNGECFLAQATNGLRFIPKTKAEWNAGDLIEVAGFPELGGPSPVLREAVARRVGQAPLPAARPLQPDDLVEPGVDSTLVRIEAVLVNCRQTRGELVLELQAGWRILVARLRGQNKAIRSIPPGSRLELTGVYVAEGGGPALQRGVESIELLLPSASDVHLLAVPPWWTLRRLLSVLGVMTMVLGAAMLWLLTLKRRVNTQTRIIREKVEREATLEERARIARELHDTLEQALAGIGLQLSALAAMLKEAPAESVRMLNVARSMVHHGQEEARRTVRNLRLLALEKTDLPTALSRMAASVSAPGQVPVEVRVTGAPAPLPATVESHLLRIGQEATANALKHARPTFVHLTLRYAPAHVQLEIADDGCGYDAAEIPRGDAGHFGLLGMRERVEKIGGSLEILSSPGAGTIVRVMIHLPYRGPEERVRLWTAGDSGVTRAP